MRNGFDLLIHMVTLAAMKFVVLAMVATLCVSCRRAENDSVWWENRKTIIALQQELELARFKAETLKQDTSQVASEVAAPDPQRLREEIGTLVIRKERLRGRLKNTNFLNFNLY